MIQNIKQKITEMIDKGELEWFMKILYLFSKSEDRRIERTSKSLIHLIDEERYGSIEPEKEIKM